MVYTFKNKSNANHLGMTSEIYRKYLFIPKQAELNN